MTDGLNSSTVPDEMNDNDETPSRRFRFAVASIVAAGVFFAWLADFGMRRIADDPKAREAIAKRPGVSSSKTDKPLIGATILKPYAHPASTPEDDLTLMSHALGNFSLLVKGDDPLPLGANEDIADALRGKNKAHLRFLPDDSPVFDRQGRIIDRWGTPLYFHAESRAHLDIRGAGPDKQMWTADDIHRRYDGSFLKGEALVSPSLFENDATLAPKR